VQRAAQRVDVIGLGLGDAGDDVPGQRSTAWNWQAGPERGT